MTRLVFLFLLHLSCYEVWCCQKVASPPRTVPSVTPSPIEPTTTPSPIELTTTVPQVKKSKSTSKPSSPKDAPVVKKDSTKGEKKCEINTSALITKVKEELYGQPLVLPVISKVLHSHLTNVKPKKSLVLSFHGSSGTGKTYLSRLLVESSFSDSSNFHVFLGSSLSITANTADKTKELVEMLKSTVRRCERAIFVVDEVDQMSSELLDLFATFMDHHEQVDGVDFRKTTFILISNRGDRDINDIVLNNREEDLRLKDFERAITNAAYNNPGGFHHSLVLKNGLVDIFVPFLPLKRSDVIKCIRHYLMVSGYDKHSDNEETINKIADSLQYFKEIYSSTGCKKVPSRTDLALGHDEL